MKNDDKNEFLPSRDMALDIILKNTSFETEAENLPLSDCLGRVAAGPAFSKNDLPNALTSRCDGIGVHFSDFANGAPDTSSWKQGSEYDFANTGVAVPGDYDTVIMIEDVEIENGVLSITVPPESKGENTSEIGSRMKKGEKLVDAYEKLTPAHLSLLAMGGYSVFDVIRKPKVGIIPSGNELVPYNMKLPEGKNVESNSIMLSSKVLEWGGIPIVYPIIPDDPDALLKTLLDAVEKTDIVFFNAGSSKGTDDYAVQTLSGAGKIFFKRVAYGPGHHTSFAISGNTPVLGLVGPPIGADFGADWFGLPLIQKFLHQPVTKMTKLKVTVAERIISGHDVEMFLRVFVWKEKGRYFARQANWDGGAMRESFIDANAYAWVEPKGEGYYKGDEIEVELKYPVESIPEVD